MVGLEGIAPQQAATQADNGQMAKRARASGESGNGMQLRRRVVTQEGLPARRQGGQREQATTKAAGKRPMRAAVEEVTGGKRARSQGGEGGEEPERQRLQAVQQSRGAADARTSDAKPN